MLHLLEHAIYPLDMYALEAKEMLQSNALKLDMLHSGSADGLAWCTYSGKLMWLMLSFNHCFSEHAYIARSMAVQWNTDEI